eukprot:2737387-Pyramimonas_sp.AAC.1
MVRLCSEQVKAVKKGMSDDDLVKDLMLLLDPLTAPTSPHAVRDGREGMMSTLCGSPARSTKRCDPARSAVVAANQRISHVRESS